MKRILLLRRKREGGRGGRGEGGKEGREGREGNGSGREWKVIPCKLMESNGFLRFLISFVYIRS